MLISQCFITKVLSIEFTLSLHFYHLLPPSLYLSQLNGKLILVKHVPSENEKEEPVFLFFFVGHSRWGCGSIKIAVTPMPGNWHYSKCRVSTVFHKIKSNLRFSNHSETHFMFIVIIFYEGYDFLFNVILI